MVPMRTTSQKNFGPNCAETSARVLQMIHGSQARTDVGEHMQCGPCTPDGGVSERCDRDDRWRLSSVCRLVAAILFVICLTGVDSLRPVHAGGMRQAAAAYSRGDYIRAANALSYLAQSGNARAQGLLGFMYENGFGVPQNAILSYKWLDLAAAHATKRERDYYLRLRNAVASKMSSIQIVEGQRLALIWAPGRW